jgi:phospho-N-acetylmuramoyl-pentapeptide-transferase
MFYHLLYPLSDHIPVFNVFRYITFRSAYAAITALLISFILGPYLIRKLKSTGVGEKISKWTPQSHGAKAGTPTMGGFLILIAVLVPILLWARLDNRSVLIILGATAWLGWVGFVDDYMKTVLHREKGLVGRYKLLGQAALGLAVGAILYTMPESLEYRSATSVPFLKNVALDLGPFYIPFVMLVVMGCSNAVNLTDGLDGLAVGMVVFCALTFAGMSYVTGHVKFSDYLNIVFLENAGELTVCCAALVGAGLGFLWFNSHPAQVFMGDVGSLSMGGFLGTLAILIKKELWLIIVGGFFVVEAMSVIIQVASFRLRGKRVFRRTPLHHHFEELGWPESKIVVRFWIVGVLLSLLTLSTLKLQ